MQWLAEVRPHATCCIYRNRPLGNLLRLQMMARHRIRTMVRRAGKPMVAAVRAHIAHYAVGRGYSESKRGSSGD